MLSTQRRFSAGLGVAFALTAAGAFGDRVHPRPGGGERQFTVICVAALSWDRVTPLFRAGQLPNLDALTVRGGTSGDIMAKDFPNRTSILASLVTGRLPQQHRITEPGDLAGSAAGQRPTPVWRHLAEAGQPCVVVGFPLAFPGEHPDNVVVSQQTPPGIPLPPALLGRVTAGKPLPRDLAITLADCLLADLGTVEAARSAVPRGSRRHLFLYFSGLGRWEDALRQVLPEAERVPLAAGYYRVLDGMLGDVLDLRGSGDDLFLISEEGNLAGRPSQRRDFPSVEHYPSFGFLWATGPGIRRGIFPTTMQPHDLTPTLLFLAGIPLPENQDGRVAFGFLEENSYFKHPLTFR